MGVVIQKLALQGVGTTLLGGAFAYVGALGLRKVSWLQLKIPRSHIGMAMLAGGLTSAAVRILLVDTPARGNLKKIKLYETAFLAAIFFSTLFLMPRIAPHFKVETIITREAVPCAALVTAGAVFAYLFTSSS
ncbi:hypothetical protein [Candidatus Neptunochlamydia vexilliferae]|uniref:Uncharacterized protein n=1 Tax=Candidatus Neptunichlamydia vexilliferae TaxID=1651774 RepID=A0ABS0AX15_9BACT|nr:hypothetical protein [Candidatus Neptunochlamydia vexilliferae]MBF5058682.1 hypothetical protein [Candidatus Neptunochlamydia vexilliferae]